MLAGVGICCDSDVGIAYHDSSDSSDDDLVHWELIDGSSVSWPWQGCTVNVMSLKNHTRNFA